MADAERRELGRARVWLPARLRAGEGEILSVTYDASDKGVLVLAAAAIAVGAKVTLTLEIPGDPPRERTVEGRVVRAEPNRDDPDGLWPHRLALALEDPLQAELESLARRHPLGAAGS